MKVLIINGSPKRDGNCGTLIRELTATFASLGVEAEVVEAGGKDIRGCLDCQYCKGHQGCVHDDLVNEVAGKFKESDGLILVSPVYFASPNGNLISLLDRLFHSRYYDVKMKVGASFAVARRAGTSTTFDVLNKYFTISGMPIVSGDYWNNGFGASKGQIEEDKEGLRNARIVAKRIVFLMEAIAKEKENRPDLLEDEPRVVTNFIH